ncbi:hypothetical protein CO661_17890 [Sinorhizobium fredii]|uniref:Uncharacterized protein n=1 Tax=Rhizobium fredii TaxID=380 RepID=A0A2A6LV90_RHIFR|nr:hypothetical protein CO661_17890 [Sinorhizobium fredii]
MAWTKGMDLGYAEASPPILIPVLVTGINPANSLAEETFRAAEAAQLDPCDKHRDERNYAANATRAYRLIQLYGLRSPASLTLSQRRLRSSVVATLALPTRRGVHPVVRSDEAAQRWHILLLYRRILNEKLKVREPSREFTVGRRSGRSLAPGNRKMPIQWSPRSGGRSDETYNSRVHVSRRVGRRSRGSSLAGNA